MSESDRQSAIEERNPPLQVAGMGKADLVAKIRELVEQLRESLGQRYDMDEAVKRQQLDIQTMSEKVRQMAKGAKKGRSQSMAVGEADIIGERYSSAPPKIVLHSVYERKTDARPYKERKQMYASLLARPVIPGKTQAQIEHEQFIELLAATKNSASLVDKMMMGKYASAKERQALELTSQSAILSSPNIPPAHQTIREESEPPREYEPEETAEADEEAQQEYDDEEEE